MPVADGGYAVAGLEPGQVELGELDAALARPPRRGPTSSTAKCAAPSGSPQLARLLDHHEARVA